VTLVIKKLKNKMLGGAIILYFETYQYCVDMNYPAAFAAGFAAAISRDVSTSSPRTDRTDCAHCAQMKKMKDVLNCLKDTESGEEKAGEECAVCMVSLKAGHTFECGHRFHVGCIKEWFENKPTGGCPLCRISIEEMVGLPKREKSSGDFSLIQMFVLSEVIRI
jgi:hypothetical protein